MPDNLLKEAIAEANQVRDAAIANAKAALEEAFVPHISSMLSKKLRNEMQDDAEDGHGRSAGEDPDYDVVMAKEQKELKSSEINAVDNKQPAAGARTSSDIDNPEQEVEKMGEATVPHDGHDPESEDVTKRKSTHDAHGNLKKEHGNHFAKAQRAHSDAMYEDEWEDEEGDDLELDLDPRDADPRGLDALAPDEEDPFGFGDEEEEDDLDLEAVIRELEADLHGLEGEDDFEIDEDISKAAKKISAKQTVKQDPPGSPAGEKRFVKLSEDEAIDETDSIDEVEVDEDFDLDEILREMDVDEEVDESAFAELQAENAMLKNSLVEHRDAVRFLKDRLEELHVLNGKLLYTNRIFKKYNLNQGQKMKVVENFDRASNIREVKLVYATLSESFVGNASRKGKKLVSEVAEGIASRPVASTKPKNPQILEEGDELARRFKKIAGLG